jgi:hypothetical protein
MKLLFGVMALVALSNIAQASQSLKLDCIPEGFDGTPEINAEIEAGNALDEVTEAPMFEQGEMGPFNDGRIVAEPLNAQYALQLFVLTNDKSEKEYLLLPKDLGDLTPGAKFKAEYKEIDQSASPAKTTHRTLNCSVN